MERDTPTGPDEVSAEWLTSVLRADGTITDQQTVAAVTPEQIAVGTGFLSDLFRLHLAGDGPGSLVIKFPASNELYRGIGEASGVYLREIEFYRDIASHCPLPTPTAHVAEVTDEGVGVLLLEDLGELWGPDHIDGLPRRETELVLTALAKHHAWGANHFDPDQQSSLVTSITERFLGPDGDKDPAPTIEAGWATYHDNKRSKHDAAIDRLVNRLPRIVPDLVASLAEPACLLHGDLRVDNLFFDDTRIVVVDHQFPLRGSGLYDVAYLVSQGMSAAERRGSDHELVDHYTSAANAAGLALDADRAWSQYTDAVLLLLIFPLGAMLGFSILGDRARDLVLTLVERWIATVTDLDLIETG